MSDTYVLYRFFGADDQLLYVGMTKNPARRFEKHGYTKGWWSDVVRIEMEHHPTIDALREAERQAIKSEKPVHNIRMNNGNGGSRPAPQRTAGRCGIVVGSVYAFGLDDGDCAVGMVEALDDDGVTIALCNWLTGLFDEDRWFPYAAIERWVVASVEQLTPGQRASDGFFYADFVKELFLMDPLGDFQTKWIEERRAAPSDSARRPYETNTCTVSP
jgi:predicted GIY-YIG superfamily endonuclease